MSFEKDRRRNEFRRSRRKAVFTLKDSQNEYDRVPGVLSKTNILDVTY